MSYHTCILQNFFDNPDKIVDYANTLEWIGPQEKDNWPGKRTNNMSEINKKLFDFITNKVLSIYFDLNVGVVKWKRSNIRFHKITNDDWLKHNKKHTRIHKDSYGLAGVVYLNKNICDEKTGTSFFDENINLMYKTCNYYNNAVIYDGCNLNHGATSIGNDDRLILCIFIDGINYKYT